MAAPSMTAPPLAASLPVRALAARLVSEAYLVRSKRNEAPAIRIVAPNRNGMANGGRIRDAAAARTRLAVRGGSADTVVGGRSTRA